MFTAPEEVCQPNDFEATGVLMPPHSTQRRVAIVPGSQHLYRLDNLLPNKRYEIRISYPATSPTDFYLKLEDRCLLRVEAVHTGVSSDPAMALAPVIYDIVLENLYLGFLFHQVYKIAASIAVVLLLGQFILLPWVRRFIQVELSEKQD
ncbi:hypothetical protein BX666DRAFT_1851390 [Dichotomocladium elegans]|nr:hypothetical protein BX666DRAFT_1851390 [Dichotomocladium elegans]